MKIEVCKGQAGLALYINDERVAGVRDNGLMEIVLSAEVDSGWLPIKTAPKDGTRFWGEVGDDGIAMFWHPEFGQFVSSFRRMTMAEGYTVDGAPFKDHSPVTHHPARWMPMP